MIYTSQAPSRHLRLIVATVLAALALCPVACRTTPPPDEEAFKALLVERILDACSRPHGWVDGDPNQKTLVFFPGWIPNRWADLEADAERELDAAGIEYVGPNNSGSWKALAGIDDATEPRGGPPMSRTHLSFSVIIEGEGAERHLRWNLYCGPTCGLGETIALSWDGERWHEKRISFHRS